MNHESHTAVFDDSLLSLDGLQGVVFQSMARSCNDSLPERTWLHARSDLGHGAPGLRGRGRLYIQASRRLVREEFTLHENSKPHGLKSCALAQRFYRERQLAQQLAGLL